MSRQPNKTMIRPRIRRDVDEQGHAATRLRWLAHLQLYNSIWSGHLSVLGREVYRSVDLFSILIVALR